MKKVAAILLAVCLLCAAGCGNAAATLPEEQRQAYENCVNYINDSSFERRRHIDAGVVEVSEPASLSGFWSDSGPLDAEALQSDYWLFTLGDTSGHDYAILAVDRETNMVIGYLPIA